MSDAPSAESPSSPEPMEEMPLISFQGAIHVVRDDQEMSQVLDLLEAEEVFGFDTETRPSFRRGVSYKPSVVQLAGRDFALVIQINRILDHRRLQALLEDPRRLKVGVAVAQDVRQLQEVIPFVPAGFVEMGDMARRCGLVKTGLRNLAAQLMGVRISKKAQTSMWSNDRLTEAQVRYAATDAWISRELYFILKSKDPGPSSPSAEPAPVGSA
jgi:ribonuclease D